MKRVAYILVLLVGLGVPALAQASPDAVIRDCAEDGDLDGHYSNSDLDQAENNLPSDLDEYSDCRSVIAGAKTSGSDKGGGRNSGSSGGGGGGGAGGGGGSGHSSGSTSSARARAAEASAGQGDQAALDTLTQSRHKPRLDVGGRTVEPGSNGLFDIASASNGMPLPLLLALIAVGLMAAAGGLHTLRRRVPALARIPLPRLPVPRIDLSRVPFPRSRR